MFYQVIIHNKKEISKLTKKIYVRYYSDIFLFFVFIMYQRWGRDLALSLPCRLLYKIVLKTYVVIENKIQGFFKPLENFRDMPEAYCISFFKHKM